MLRLGSSGSTKGMEQKSLDFQKCTAVSNKARRPKWLEIGQKDQRCVGNIMRTLAFTFTEIGSRWMVLSSDVA